MNSYSAVATIVFYNNSAEQVVAVVKSCLDLNDTAILIVDNSPADSIREIVNTLCVCDLSDRIKYIHTPENPGFGASHNLALQYFPEADFYYVVNPDVTFNREVNRMVDFMQANPHIGCLVPKVMYPDGRLQRLCKLLPSPLDLFLRRFSPAMASITDKRFMLADFDYSILLDIPYASGCFMLIRGDVFRHLKGFDERFFMYLEDTDLSRRIAEISRVVFYPDVSITHEYGKGSYKDNKLLRIHLSSAVKYFNKWGWVFDRKRCMLNEKTLNILKHAMSMRK